MTSCYVVIALHRPVVNLMNPTRATHLYHFSSEHILAWTPHNLACPLVQHESIELHLTILEQICIRNHISEAQIHVLLSQAQTWETCSFYSSYGHFFWSTHPCEAEVLLYLNQHPQYQEFDHMGQRHLLYPEPECSGIDDHLDPDAAEPVGYFDSDNDSDLEDYHSDA